MAAAPRSIKAYTIPLNENKLPYLETLQTIETPILELTYPEGLKSGNQKRLEMLKKEAADTHLVYDLPEGVQKGIHEGVYKGRSQPNIRLLPDVSKRWRVDRWEGWEKRAAMDMGRYHLFYSRGKETTLGLNGHAHSQVSGEMFLLKVSDTVDEDGRRFYVDANPPAEESDDMEETIGTLSFLDYYGTHHPETEILAYLLPQDVTLPRTKHIQVISKPPNAEPFRPYGPSPSDEAFFSKTKEMGFFSHVIFCRDRQSPQTPTEMRPLPETQPKRREEWDDEAWDKRVTVGDAEYHMFLTLAKEGEQHPNPNIGGEFPVWGDVFILKVSSDLDHNGQWFYEDVDQDFKLSPGQLEKYVTHLASTVAYVTGVVERSWMLMMNYTTV